MALILSPNGVTSFGLRINATCDIMFFSRKFFVMTPFVMRIKTTCSVTLFSRKFLVITPFGLRINATRYITLLAARPLTCNSSTARERSGLNLAGAEWTSANVD